MFLSLLQESLISVTASRLRTFLAMLGIVIGVGSVVLMLAIGTGSRKRIEDAIERLGSNMLIVTPGGDNRRGQVFSGFSWLTEGDAKAIAQLPSVIAAAPSTSPSSYQATAGKLNWKPQVIGTTADYFSIRNWKLLEGDIFTQKDIEYAGRVGIVGVTLANKLFPGESALGRIVRLNTLSIRIIGVLEPKGQGLDGRDQDDVIFLPFQTAQRKLMGVTGLAINTVPVIFTQVARKDLTERAQMEIMDLLRQRHRLKPTEADRFRVRSLTSISQTATATASALSMLLGAIASISLVVGGIGIMNIMLVTVTERTREIGIRKAIGSSDGAIMLQFLMEAVMISGIGSLIGLITGIGGAIIANTYFDVPIYISAWSVVISLGVAGPVGILSGLYPARRASKLQPIEALRQVAA